MVICLIAVVPTMATAQDCSYDYGWLETVEDRKDLKKHVLFPDTGTSPKINAIDNPNFGENDTDTPELTTDTMLKRVNTTFGDTGNPDYKHWIFSRAFRLPSGDTFPTIEDLNQSGDTTTDNLMTLAFIHAGHIDGTSDDWLVPFVKKYVENCHKRPVNVVWFGAEVTKNGSPNYSGGSKWHLTSSKWGRNNTVIYDVMTESEQIVSGHSTVNCPKEGDDGSDTAGIYVGGGSETDARRVSARFEDSFYVGSNSDSQGVCYSGVVDNNPVNAAQRGVQFEYNVNLDRGGDRLDTSAVARSILAEMNINTGPVIVDGDDAYANGNSGNCSDTWGGAHRLIQSGINRSSASDTVTICSGTSGNPITYRENVSIDSSNLNVRTTGDSTETVLEASNDSRPVLEVRSDSVDIRSLTVRSGTTGIRMTGTSNGWIEDVRFTKNLQYGLEVRQSDSTTLRKNHFSNKSQGILLRNDTNVTVHNNRFDSNLSVGLTLAGDGRNHRIKNNVLMKNDTALNIVSPGSGGTELHLNRISGNKVGLYYDGDTVLHAESNWWGSEAGPSGDIKDAATGERTTSTGDSVVLNPGSDTRVAFMPQLEFDPSKISLSPLEGSTTLPIPGGDTLSVKLDHDTTTADCNSRPINFFGTVLPKSESRISSYPDNASDTLSSNGFDTMLSNVNLTSDRSIQKACVTVTIDVESLNYEEGNEFEPVIYQRDRWVQLRELSGGTVINDTPTEFVFEVPHFSSFGIVSSSTTSNNSEPVDSSDDQACLIESLPVNSGYLDKIRTFRDFAMNGTLGRWLVNQYYRTSRTLDF